MKWQQQEEIGAGKIINRKFKRKKKTKPTLLGRTKKIIIIRGEKHLGSRISQCSISERKRQIIYEFMVYYGKKHIEESEWFKEKHHFTKRIIKVFNVSLLKLHLKCSVQCRTPTSLS